MLQREMPFISFLSRAVAASPPSPRLCCRLVRKELAEKEGNNYYYNSCKYKYYYCNNYLRYNYCYCCQLSKNDNLLLSSKKQRNTSLSYFSAVKDADTVFGSAWLFIANFICCCCCQKYESIYCKLCRNDF